MTTSSEKNKMETTQATPKPEVMVSKMSVKSIGCKPFGAPLTDPKKLCTILGKATGIKCGEDANGNVYSALIGSFRAEDLMAGNIFRSGKLFLPSGIHDAVETMVKQLPDSGGAVKFAMLIQSVEANNPIGYSYQAINLMPIEAETDELSDVIASAAVTQARLNASVAQLQLPTPEPTPPVSSNKKK